MQCFGSLITLYRLWNNVLNDTSDNFAILKHKGDDSTKYGSCSWWLQKHAEGYCAQ